MTRRTRQAVFVIVLALGIALGAGPCQESVEDGARMEMGRWLRIEQTEPISCTRGNWSESK